MKKYICEIAVILLLASCNSGAEGFSLNGELSGEVNNGTLVFLKKANENNQPVDVDTTTVENGSFIFNGTAAGPEIHYIFVDKLGGNIPVIIENGEIEVSAQKDSLGFARIKGTLQNNLFSDYLKEIRGISAKARSLNDDMRAAASRRDTVAMNSLRDEYFEIQEEAKNFEIDFARENPQALISLLIIDKSHTTRALSEEEVQELYEGLTDEIKASSAGKKLKGKLEKGKNTSVGSKAPNFSAPTPSGEELALNDVLGKATILDFWAAWCRPCRAENPNVVKIYNKYQDKGLSILGVSLDRKAEDWKKAIEDDGLAWNHVSNVQYFDEIAQLYNVNSIPATFILDENGVIVAKNLRGPALEEKIAEMLQ